MRLLSLGIWKLHPQVQNYSFYENSKKKIFFVHVAWRIAIQNYNNVFHCFLSYKISKLVKFSVYLSNGNSLHSICGVHVPKIITNNNQCGNDFFFPLNSVIFILLPSGYRNRIFSRCYIIKIFFLDPKFHRSALHCLFFAR